MIPLVSRNYYGPFTMILHCMKQLMTEHVVQGRCVGTSGRVGGGVGGEVRPTRPFR